jgi:hypothetical protein
MIVAQQFFEGMASFLQSQGFSINNKIFIFMIYEKQKSHFCSLAMKLN